MIHLIRRLLDFFRERTERFNCFFYFQFIECDFEMLPIIAILTVLSEMFFNSGWRLDVCFDSMEITFVIMLASIAGRIVFSNLSCMKRTIGSFSVMIIKDWK